MLHLCGRLGFILEAAELLAVAGDAERQDLQRDTTTQRLLPCLVDHTHAAAADFADESIVADCLRRLGQRAADDRPVNLRRGSRVKQLQAAQVPAELFGRSE